MNEYFCDVFQTGILIDIAFYTEIFKGYKYNF